MLRAAGRPMLRLRRVQWFVVLEVAFAAFACWLHVRSLPSLPRGFYKDETSIAYNAYLIATTGQDEFGVSWPLYTQSFDDYKNAGYLYLSVAVMRIAGLSLWTVRMPSFLCWVAGTLFFYLLARRVWPDRWSRTFLLLQLAFTPSLWCLSRIGFEAIGLYPTLGLFLLGVYRGFEERSLKWAALGGLGIGLSTYMYSTFRLLAPLHCLLVLACYARREHLMRLAGFAASAAVSVIPFAWFLVEHGDLLTMRYREIGYAHEDMPLSDKLSFFAARYSEYCSPGYLLRYGDGNLRHHTGYGGELFLPTLIMLFIGIGAILARPALRRVRFHWLLLGGLVLSPVAAALTKSQNHSLQAFSLVLFAIALATCGVRHVLRRAPSVLSALVLAGTALKAFLFVAYYFGPYRTVSIAAFEFYGQRQAIEKAIAQGATRIILDRRRPSRHPELHAGFYRVILSARYKDKLPPLEPGKPSDVGPGEFFVFQDEKNQYADLRDGMPEGALYLAAPYGRVVDRPRLRANR
jgi:4-amino-4-deoxy-L-arabinose transferase-like glycosyltransferase